MSQYRLRTWARCEDHTSRGARGGPALPLPTGTGFSTANSLPEPLGAGLELGVGNYPCTSRACYESAMKINLVPRPDDKKTGRCAEGETASSATWSSTLFVRRRPPKSSSERSSGSPSPSRDGSKRRRDPSGLDLLQREGVGGVVHALVEPSPGAPSGGRASQSKSTTRICSSTSGAATNLEPLVRPMS